jgi:uncharacterized surface protein with fasciclin (FAS1) repeats
MKAKLFSSSALLLLISLLFNQCSDPHARYKDPPWLGGTNIETLEEQENYSIFLQLMDLAEYRTSIENQLFTLFVPSDSAFEAYFLSAGISSVDDITKRQAEEIFGLHILINPRSREQLLFEYAWGELQDPRGEYGTLFHRKQSYSYPKDYSEENKYDPDFEIGEVLPIWRDRVYIPLWSSEYFEDYNGDPEGSDYLYMYPESSWSGLSWHDAMVVGNPASTSSGFIYYLDKVVAPPHSIETFLRDNQDEVGLYYEIAQRFADYTQPTFDENDVRRYRKSYNQIIDFAQTNGPGGGPPSSLLYQYTATIPKDAPLQEFLDRTVYAENDSLEHVPPLFLVYLLNSQLSIRLVLPSTLESRYQNYFGDFIPVNLETDIDRTFTTCNGPVYITNKFLEPNVFSCVPGPLFYDSDYSTFLYALENSQQLTPLTKPEIDVTLFAPTNDELLEYGIRETESGGNVSIQILASDETWHAIETKDLEDFVGDFIYFGKYDDLNGEGYIRMASDNYIYFNNDEIVGGGNQLEADVVNVVKVTDSGINGSMFYVDNAIKRPLNVAEFVFSDPDLSEFGALMSQAGMIDSLQDPYELLGVEDPRIIGYNALQQWTVFAPSNAAILAAEGSGLIPHDLDGDADTLKRFLQYHFVRERSIFDDGSFNGIVESNRSDTATSSGLVFQTMDIMNTPGSLSVEDGSGQTVNVDHADANNFVEHGVLHKINTVLLKE